MNNIMRQREEKKFCCHSNKQELFLPLHIRFKSDKISIAKQLLNLWQGL